MHSLSEEEMDQLYDWVESWPEVAKVYRHPLRPCVQFWPLHVSAHEYHHTFNYAVCIYQIDWEAYPDTGSLHYSRCITHHHMPYHNPIPTTGRASQIEISHLHNQEVHEWGEGARDSKGYHPVCYGNTHFDINDPVKLMLQLCAFATAMTQTSDKLIIDGYPGCRMNIPHLIMVNSIVMYEHGVKTVPLEQIPEYSRSIFSKTYPPLKEEAATSGS